MMSTIAPPSLSPSVTSFVGDMRAEPTDDPFAELLATLIGASGALAMQPAPAETKSPAPPADHAIAAEPDDGRAAHPLTRAIARLFRR